MSAVQIQKDLNLSAYFNLVSFSLLFYDYFLVLDWEISRYWGTPFTWPNILFFANRYGTLLGNIPVVMEYFWSENSTPEKIKWSVLSGKAVDKSTNLPLYFGCNYPTSKAQGVSLATAWAGVAVFDCMIFLLTLYKVFTRRRPNGGDLLTVLLRDGLMLPSVMVISNSSNILTFIPYTKGIATTLVNVTSSIMITRLMLNLRDPALAHMAGRQTQSTTFSGNVRFAPYLGATAPELDTDAVMDIELRDRRAPLSPPVPSGTGVEMA
ncbi:hypothetical protein B0H14DRAFT_3036789 [Mycena olivaceomarginata]|nr:hypothetical protein B0H14DRAFT_3036789 [Mycena olivaceomarginata]